MKDRFKYWVLEALKLIISGAIIGVIIALYKYAATFTIKSASFFFNSNDFWIRVLYAVLSIITMFIAYAIIRFDGNVQGGGIAQVDVHVKKNVRQIKWYRSLPLMFISSLLSFFNGLPFGSEAPSCFLGAMVNMGSNKVYNDEDDDIYLGMGAGFAAAFTSPLAGLCYCFEECLEKFKLKNLIKLLIITPVAAIVSYLINQEHIIHFHLHHVMEFKYYYVFVFLFLVNCTVSHTVRTCVPGIKKYINNHQDNFFVKYRFFIIFGLSIILVNVFPLITGSGSLLMNYIKTNPVWYIILIYLIIRMLMFFFAGNCMATGGMLLPCLTLGALSGYIVCNVSSKLFGFTEENYELIILISMNLVFALVNRAPFTAFILTLSFAGIDSLNITLIPALAVLVITTIIVYTFKIVSLNDLRVKLLRTSRQ